MTRTLGCLLAITYLVIAPTAIADPDNDPHVPNRAAQYCPGGIRRALQAGGRIFRVSRLRGVPYPDGSFQLTTSTNPASLCACGTILHWTPVADGDNDCARATRAGGETVGR